MSIQAPMNPAESLLNFIVHHTDLYMRTKRGETAGEHQARWTAAFRALSPFLADMRRKERVRVAELCCSACRAVLAADESKSKGANL